MVPFYIVFLLFSFTDGRELNCGEEILENCTEQLMQYSRDDVPVPETEDQVIENCG